MKDLFALLGRFLAWVFARVREAEAAEERAKINTENAARLERQNEVAQRPVSNEDLQKSLRDGTF